MHVYVYIQAIMNLFISVPETAPILIIFFCWKTFIFMVVLLFRLLINERCQKPFLLLLTSKMRQNFGKRRSMRSIISRRWIILSPAEYQKTKISKDFEISNRKRKVGLVAYLWKGLFKTMILIQMVFFLWWLLKVIQGPTEIISLSWSTRLLRICVGILKS